MKKGVEKNDSGFEAVLNSDVLPLLMHDAVDKIGGSPVDAWEGHVKVELTQMPSEVRPAAGKYLEVVLALTRTGVLQPDEYARRIIKENYGPPTGRYILEAAARVHDKMVVEALQGTDEDAKKYAQALSSTFEEVLDRSGFLHESGTGRAMGYLLDEFKRFPQQPAQPAGA